MQPKETNSSGNNAISCPDGSLGIKITNEKLLGYEKTLCFDKYDVVKRYDSIFYIKTIGGEEALELLQRSKETFGNFRFTPEPFGLFRL